MRKILPYILPFLFLLIIGLPFVNTIFNIWNFERKSENRTFKDELHIKLTHLSVFPKQAEEYVNDNFSFRTPLLNAYSYEKFYWFHISPHPEKTIIGSDGWFFMSQEELKVYEGKNEFSTSQLKQFDSVWVYRKHYLDSLNIKSYWVIGPMKHYIYEENLPFNISKKPGKTRVEILTANIQKKFPGFIIDPTQEFFLAKDSLQLYYKLDNHWNKRAGFVVSKLILSKLKVDFPSIKIPAYNDYNWVDTSLALGFHRDVVGIESLREKDKFPYDKNESALKVDGYGFPVTENFPYPGEFEKVFRNNSDSTLPRILIIRDSFGDLLIPFLKEPFSESVYIFDGWEYGLNKEIIETVKPDIVIFLGLETHLENYIER